jgi:hypothetical protein
MEIDDGYVLDRDGKHDDDWLDDAHYLWEHCEEFILKHGITCPESVYQQDDVILNALEFIDGICEIIGYAKEKSGGDEE